MLRYFNNFFQAFSSSVTQSNRVLYVQINTGDTNDAIILSLKEKIKIQKNYHLHIANYEFLENDHTFLI